MNVHIKELNKDCQVGLGGQSRRYSRRKKIENYNFIANYESSSNIDGILLKNMGSQVPVSTFVDVCMG